MAGDWIKMRKKLVRDGRVLSVSRTCRAIRATVVGALVALWSLADDYAEQDGLLPGWTVEDIDKEVEVPGFCAALPADWLEVIDGLVYLPNYQTHNGDTAKRRAENTERQKLSRDSRDKSATREEKRREEKNKGGVPPLTPLAAKNQSDPSASLGSKTPDPKPDASTKPRPRDLLFDAIADVTGSDPKASGGHIGKVAASLKKADPAYTPDEVRAWAVKIRELWGMQPTLGMIEKHIGKIRSADPLTWSRPGKTNGHKTDHSGLLEFISREQN